MLNQIVANPVTIVQEDIKRLEDTEFHGQRFMSDSHNKLIDDVELLMNRKENQENQPSDIDTDELYVILCLVLDRAN